MKLSSGGREGLAVGENHKKKLKMEGGALSSPLETALEEYHDDDDMPYFSQFDNNFDNSENHYMLMMKPTYVEKCRKHFSPIMDICIKNAMISTTRDLMVKYKPETSYCSEIFIILFFKQHPRTKRNIYIISTIISETTQLFAYYLNYYIHVRISANYLMEGLNPTEMFNSVWKVIFSGRYYYVNPNETKYIFNHSYRFNLTRCKVRLYNIFFGNSYYNMNLIDEKFRENNIDITKYDPFFWCGAFFKIVNGVLSYIHFNFTIFSDLHELLISPFITTRAGVALSEKRVEAKRQSPSLESEFPREEPNRDDEKEATSKPELSV